MATRSKRASATPSLAEVSETNLPNVDASHLRQKDVLSGLNVRLANYIETVQRLEAENNKLRLQVREVEVIEHREKEDLIARFQAKIDDLRAQVDALNRDRSQAVVERDTAVHNFADLKIRFDKLDKEFKTADRERNAYLNRINDLNARLKEDDALRLQVGELKTLIAKQDERIATLSKQVEDETVLRSTAQSRLKNLEDELAFTRRSHDNDIREITRKRQVEIEHAITDSNALANSLAEQLENSRHEFDTRLAAIVDEITNKNKKEIELHRRNVEDARNEASKVRDEFVLYRSQAAAKEKVNNDLQKRVDELLKSVAELESRIEFLHQDYADRLRRKDMRLAELDSLSKQYQDLLIVKGLLDNELAAYRHMLELEETRLHITPNSSLNSSGFTPDTSRRGVKRRRVESDLSYSNTKFVTSSNETGDIAVTDIDADKQAVTITNHGVKDIPIGGWRLNVTADAHEVTFKFGGRQVIKAGTSISVYSHTTTETHQPPHRLVMKNQDWPFGEEIRAEVQNDKAEVVASRTLTLNAEGSNQEGCFII